MQKNYISLTVGAILVIIFGFMLFTFQVRQTQVAIKTQFGDVVMVGENKAGIKPGFHFRWPWPINKVQKFDNRLQSSETAFAQKSIQGGTILIKTFVNWKIDDNNPRDFYESSGRDSTRANTLIRDQLAAVTTDVIGGYSFNQIVSAEKETTTTTDPDTGETTTGPNPDYDLKLDEIETKLTEQVREKTATYGIDVKMVGIKRIGLPASVTGAVFERMKAERMAEAEIIEAEAELQAQTLKAQADLEANIILAQAQAKAIQIRGAAEADAAKYFEVFKQNPELANFLFNLKALEGSLKENATLVLDPSTPPFNLLTKPNRDKAAE